MKILNVYAKLRRTRRTPNTPIAVRRYCALDRGSFSVAVFHASIIVDTHFSTALFLLAFVALDTMSKATVYDISQQSRQNKQ